MELQAFWKSCVRVLRVTKKPDQREFIELVKVTGLGLAVIGAIGFIIQLAAHYITG